MSPACRAIGFCKNIRSLFIGVIGPNLSRAFTRSANTIRGTVPAGAESAIVILCSIFVGQTSTVTAHLGLHWQKAYSLLSHPPPQLLLHKPTPRQCFYTVAPLPSSRSQQLPVPVVDRPGHPRPLVPRQPLDKPCCLIGRPQAEGVLLPPQASAAPPGAAASLTELGGDFGTIKRHCRSSLPGGP